jgi:ankyrin repeat protein
MAIMVLKRSCKHFKKHKPGLNRLQSLENKPYVGVVVELAGLVGGAEHNGKLATVHCYKSDKERFELELLESGKRMDVRPSNFVLKQLPRGTEVVTTGFLSPTEEHSIQRNGVRGSAVAMYVYNNTAKRIALKTDCTGDSLMPAGHLCKHGEWPGGAAAWAWPHTLAAPAEIPNWPATATAVALPLKNLALVPVELPPLPVLPGMSMKPGSKNKTDIRAAIAQGLISAAGEGDLPGAWRGLAAGADPNAVSGHVLPAEGVPAGVKVPTCSALSRAAAKNHVEMARLLWSAGASLEDEYLPPLIAAAMNGSFATLQLLIALGADVNARLVQEDGAGAWSWDDMTAFHMACYFNHVRCVDALLRAGCNVRHTDGETGRQLAQQQGNTEVVECLRRWAGGDPGISSIADPISRGDNSRGPTNEAVNRLTAADEPAPEHLHTESEKEGDPAPDAAAEPSPWRVWSDQGVLYSTGTSGTEITNGEKLVASVSSAAFADFAGDRSIIGAIERMLAAGVDPNCVVCVPHAEYSHLQGCHVQHAGVIRMVTPLWVATDQPGITDAQLREENGAESLSAAGQTLLQQFTPEQIRTVRSDRLEITRTLLDAGADPNLVFGVSETPLMRAALRGHLGVLKLLIERGANLGTAETQSGSTALHYAVQYNNPDCVEALARADQAGRAMMVEDCDGQTGLQLAILLKRTAVLERLKALAKQAIRHAPSDGVVVLAAKTGDTAKMSEWLDCGADPNSMILDKRAKDKGRMTALYIALEAKHTHSRCSMQTIRLLLERGADPNMPCDLGPRPLMAAAALGRPEV